MTSGEKPKLLVNAVSNASHAVLDCEKPSTARHGFGQIRNEEKRMGWIHAVA